MMLTRSVSEVLNSESIYYIYVSQANFWMPIALALLFFSTGVAFLWSLYFREDDTLLKQIIYDWDVKKTFILGSQPELRKNTAYQIVQNLQLYWPSVQRRAWGMIFIPLWQLILAAAQFTILNLALQKSFWLYPFDGDQAEVLFPLQVNCDLEYARSDGVNRTNALCTVPINKFYRGNIPQL